MVQGYGNGIRCWVTVLGYGTCRPILVQYIPTLVHYIPNRVREGSATREGRATREAWGAKGKGGSKGAEGNTAGGQRGGAARCSHGRKFNGLY